jgi:predicted ATPase/DNA-binding CsgD family transcriptional regulator
MNPTDTLPSQSDSAAIQVADAYRLPTARCYPNNLPLELNRFIGRERELREIKPLLWSTRLLTLTGPGGCGKTRLALRLAADLLDAFADGVWLVELAALSDPALVAQAVATALVLREQAGRPVQQVLIDYFESRECLLVLDNCEHLILACAQLVEALLRVCPNLHILATSREALNIAGEIAWLTPPLSLPDPKARDLTNALQQSEAVQLFVDRVTLAQPAFAVTEQNAAAVMQICQRLDGLPLAIELAAARAKTMSIKQIAARLDDRFRLLTHGNRTALPRHQTLRATIDWSHSLLDEQERSVFRRLSVFAGGWTIDAAEAVCAGTGIESPEVLTVLLRLVDKSLIWMDAHNTATRYHMLETIREYAWEQLWVSGEADNVQQEHFAFFLQFAEKDEPGWEADESRQWRERLEIDVDNLRRALDWSLNNSTESGLRLAGVVGHFALRSPYQREALDWLRKFVACPELFSHTLARAKALRWSGILQRSESWSDQADKESLLQQSRLWCEESLSIYQELGYQPGIADTLLALGWVMLTQHSWEAMGQLCADSLRISQEMGDMHRAARALVFLGINSHGRGDRTQARRLYGEALRVYRESGLRYASWLLLTNLGELALHEGDLTSARSYVEESLALYREFNGERSGSEILITLAEIATRQGRFDEARQYIEQSMEFRKERGFGLGDEFLQLALMVFFQGDYGQADKLYKKSLPWLTKKSDPNISYAVEGLANVAAMQNKARRAVTLFGAAAALREVFDTPLPPINQADNERGIAAARAQLDEATFMTAWKAGRDMLQEQVIAYALAESGTASQINDPSLSAALPHAGKAKFDGLTAREREVAALVAQGQSNRDIAATLVLSERTVASHVSNILSKLEFNSRTQIAAWAIEKGLVNPSTRGAE